MLTGWEYLLIISVNNVLEDDDHVYVVFEVYEGRTIYDKGYLSEVERSMCRNVNLQPQT